MDDRTHGAKIETSNDMLLRDDGTGLREDKVMPPGTKPRPRSRRRPIFVLGIAVLLGLGIYRITETLRAPRSRAVVRKPRRNRSAWPPSAPATSRSS